MLNYLKLAIISIILLSCFGQIPSGNNSGDEVSFHHLLVNNYWTTRENNDVPQDWERWRFYNPGENTNIFTTLRRYYYRANNSFIRSVYYQYKLQGRTLIIKYDGKEYKLNISNSGNRLELKSPLPNGMFDTRLYRNILSNLE